jgi:thioredoxin-dependent peroxiredoxin
MAIQAGAKAPTITLTTDSGAPLKLSSYQGKHVVVFFYPKADTPG